MLDYAKACLDHAERVLIATPDTGICPTERRGDPGDRPLARVLRHQLAGVASVGYEALGWREAPRMRREGCGGLMDEPRRQTISFPDLAHRLLRALRARWRAGIVRATAELVYQEQSHCLGSCANRFLWASRGVCADADGGTRSAV